MASRKKKRPRRRVSKKKKSPLINPKRFLSFVLLSLILGVSICAVGYVIFFRTVFAQEIPKQQETEIVFEEPNPPTHDEPTSDLSGTKTTPTQKDLPKVAIIIDDLGYHKKLGEKFLNFSYELTYSFLPFAPYTAKQEEIAFNSGKTVLLHLPLEPKGKQWDPGPGTLYVSDSLELQKEKFEQALAQVPHAVGVNNHMGSLFTADRVAMKRVLSQIKARDLFFVDSITTAESAGLQLAEELELPFEKRSVFLDNTLEEQEICKQLEKLVSMAELKEKSIGIGHPHIETFNALQRCVSFYVLRVEFCSLSDILLNSKK